MLCVSILLLIPAAAWGTLLGHKEDLYYSAIILGVVIVTGIAYLIVGSGVRCPLCHGLLIGKPGCSRSQKADRTFGSHRLGVALRVILLGRFRCQCCGEPCKCEARS